MKLVLEFDCEGGEDFDVDKLLDTGNVQDEIEGYVHDLHDADFEIVNATGWTASDAERDAALDEKLVTLEADTVKQARELLITLGDFVGNVDPKTNIDRCAVVLALTQILQAAEVSS